MLLLSGKQVKWCSSNKYVKWSVHVLTYKPSSVWAALCALSRGDVSCAGGETKQIQNINMENRITCDDGINRLPTHLYQGQGLAWFSKLTGLWRPSVESRISFWSFDVGSSYHCEAEFPKRECSPTNGERELGLNRRETGLFYPTDDVLLQSKSCCCDWRCLPSL